MLVITRTSLKANATDEDRKYATIRIGDSITVTVLSSSCGKVKLGVDAPDNLVIARSEIYDVVKASRERFEGAHQ